MALVRLQQPPLLLCLPRSRPSLAGGVASRPALSSRVLLSAIAEVIRRNKVAGDHMEVVAALRGVPMGASHSA